MRKILSLTCALALCGCGTYVPNIRPLSYSPTDGIELVRGITQSIECELRRAVVEVIDADIRVAALNQGIRSAPWIDGWGVQLALTLTMVENSGATPGVGIRLPTVTDPTPNVILGGSAPLTAKATRRLALNYYYLVADLYQLGICTEDTIASLPNGSRLIRSDLKIGEWLLAQTLAAGTGAIPVSRTTNALTQRIDFVATYGAAVNANFPSISSTVNAITLSTSAGRTSSHSVIMTFGAPDPRQAALSGSAADAFLAAQIGSEIREVN